MKTDRFTKFILTIIAICLSVNLLSPLFAPSPAMAQGTAKRWTEIKYTKWGNNTDGDLLRKGYEPFAAGAYPGGGGFVYFRK